MSRTKIRRGLLPRAYEASYGMLAMQGRPTNDGMATNADWWPNLIADTAFTSRAVQADASRRAKGMSPANIRKGGGMRLKVPKS